MVTTADDNAVVLFFSSVVRLFVVSRTFVQSRIQNSIEYCTFVTQSQELVCVYSFHSRVGKSNEKPGK